MLLTPESPGMGIAERKEEEEGGRGERESKIYEDTSHSTSRNAQRDS
jgi:hypothetical protein